MKNRPASPNFSPGSIPDVYPPQLKKPKRSLRLFCIENGILVLFAGLGYYVGAGHSLDDADQQHQGRNELGGDDQAKETDIG